MVRTKTRVDPDPTHLMRWAVIRRTIPQYQMEIRVERRRPPKILYLVLESNKKPDFIGTKSLLSVLFVRNDASAEENTPAAAASGARTLVICIS